MSSVQIAEMQPEELTADELDAVSGGSVRDYLEGVATGIAIALIFV